jgi:protein-S-isoprenylcysteine O-methyltransferase Ste14
MVETGLDVLAIIVFLYILFQHVWAVRGHFTSERMALPAKLISLMVVVTSLYFLYLTWTESQPAIAQTLGAAIGLASLQIFRAAIAASKQARLRFAFDEQKPHGLVVSGPYRHVRHPFYTSYLMFWTGWAIATWTSTAAVPVAIILVLYVLAARMEERNFAHSPLATEYADYRRRTGFFWPRLSR